MNTDEHHLIEGLGRHGIDASTLGLLVDFGTEKIYYVTVHGAEAIDLWHRLRGITEQTGRWPVIIGDDESLEMHLEGFDINRDTSQPSAADILIASTATDPVEWLSSFEIEDPDYEEPRGDWSDDIELNTEFTIPTYYPNPGDYETRAPNPRIHMALVPTTVCWQVPAFLRYGGWNYCPEPDKHVAAMKRWYELYGAEVVGMSHDTTEMIAFRPPTTREAAIDLALEQYAYAPDIIWQGIETIEALAATLLNGSAWYFWWD